MVVAMVVAINTCLCALLFYCFILFFSAEISEYLQFLTFPVCQSAFILFLLPILPSYPTHVLPIKHCVPVGFNRTPCVFICVCA